MYGAKRLTIEKSGMIVIQGNRSYKPIGKFFNVNGEIVGKLRNINITIEKGKRYESKWNFYRQEMG